MPCHYEIFSDLNVAKIVLYGVVQPRQIVELLDRLNGDPGYSDTIDELIYLDQHEGYFFEPELQRNLLNLIRGMFLMGNRQKRIALVAGQEPGAAMARAVAEVLGQNSRLDVRVFDGAGGAMSFLGQGDHRLLERMRVLH